MREKYESLSATVLRDLAKSRGIKSTSTMKKADLVEAMLAEDAKKEKEKAAQMKGNKKNKNSKTVSESGKKQPKLNSASKVKGGQNVSIRDAAHKSTKDKDVNTTNK